VGVIAIAGCTKAQVKVASLSLYICNRFFCNSNTGGEVTDSLLTVAMNYAMYQTAL